MGPVVVCDHCDRSIDYALDGNYQWWRPAERGLQSSGKIYFTHKRCATPFEGRPGETHRGTWLSRGLEVLPIYLANSLNLDLDYAREQAEAMAGL